MRTAILGLVALAFLPQAAAFGQEIHWATSYDEALEESRERGVLLLCVLTMSGEDANEQMMALWGKSRSVAQVAQGFVCCFANRDQHREITRKVDGKNVSVCPILGTVPCKAHREMEQILVRRYTTVFQDATGNIRTPVAWLADGEEKVLDILAAGDKSVGFDVIAEGEVVSRLKAAIQKYGAGLSAAQYRRVMSLLQEARDLEQKGEYTAAAEKYQEVVKASPERISAGKTARERLDAIGTMAEDKLAQAEDLIGKGEYAPAMSLLEEVAKGFRFTSAETRANQLLEELRAKPEVARMIEEEHARLAAEKLLAEARKLDAAKRWVKAVEAYREVVEAHPETEAGKAAAKRIAEMEADPAISGEIREAMAKKDCTKWLSLARNFMSANLPDQAREQLQKVIDTYPGTSYAATAKKLLAELR